MGESGLPFVVGQFVEARSFVHGYRGAWFRCKVKGIKRKNNVLRYALEYYDFPDEKIRWTKLYQKLPRTSGRNPKEHKKQLMVRPQFPTVYLENKMPDVSSISEEVVVINDWKIGDLVDWWVDGCYWSGWLKFDDQKYKIELHPPPVGEGSTYEVSFKNLRPSLDWCLDNGWTVPIPEDGENRPCARLFKPVNQGSSPRLVGRAVSEEKMYSLGIARGLDDHIASSSQTSTSSLTAPERLKHTEKQPLATASSETCKPELNIDFDGTDIDIRKTSCSDSVSSSYVKGASADVAGATAAREASNGGPLKKTRAASNFSQNSMTSDTIEATILDLEELVSRVKWTKNILESGNPSLHTSRPMWKFLENPASLIPK